MTMDKLQIEFELNDALVKENNSLKKEIDRLNGVIEKVKDGIGCGCGPYPELCSLCRAALEMS